MNKINKYWVLELKEKKEMLTRENMNLNSERWLAQNKHLNFILNLSQSTVGYVVREIWRKKKKQKRHEP